MTTPDYYKLNLELSIKDLIDLSNASYHLGTALAYLYRAGKKNDNPFGKDILKAIQHLEFEINKIKTYQVLYIQTSDIDNITGIFNLRSLFSQNMAFTTAIEVIIDILDYLCLPVIKGEDYCEFLEKQIIKLAGLTKNVHN